MIRAMDLGRLLFLAGFPAALLLGTFPPLRAESYLEAKMNYERHLEQKVEEVLSNLVGPGKTRVMIRASVDFSTKENLQTEQTAAATNEDFTWRSAGIAPAAAKELLPGFADESSQTTPQTSKVQREIVVPQTMVKRLTVSLVLSDSLTDTQTEKVRQVVSELLNLETARGDDLLITRAPFAPIWYTSEMLDTLVKYGILSIIAIFGMGIVAVGFLKMASAMRSAGYSDSGTRIRMEMGMDQAAGGGLGAEDSLLAALPGAERAAASKGAAETAHNAELLEISPDKLDILVMLLAKDEPADIALIAAHLPKHLKARFISMLTPQMAADVVASLAKVRLMDPDMLAKVKEELKRQLGSAFGGYSATMALVEELGISAKKSLLDRLHQSHPDIASAIREKVLLMDDLDLLEEKDFSLLAGGVPVETWGAAAWRMSDGAKEKLKTALGERAWLIIQQTMSYGAPAEDKTEGASVQVLAALSKLIAEGRVKRPGRKNYPTLTGPAA